jgi:hypothetical protein
VPALTRARIKTAATERLTCLGCSILLLPLLRSLRAFNFFRL